jgi:hypothetical protein
MTYLQLRLGTVRLARPHMYLAAGIFTYQYVWYPSGNTAHMDQSKPLSRTCVMQATHGMFT